MTIVSKQRYQCEDRCTPTVSSVICRQVIVMPKIKERKGWPFLLLANRFSSADRSGKVDIKNPGASDRPETDHGSSVGLITIAAIIR